MNSNSLRRRISRSAPFACLVALPLAGCMSLADYGEAPGYETGYPGTPQDVSGWYGRDVASVDVFTSSLGRYGRWDVHPGYGRVFVPIGVRSGWQPYRDGYWAVDPRYGRRWISSEPFGWATYHYGRWARDPRLGWFWVPDTRFGPGWVNWREGGGYSGWAPLPPFGWERWGVGYNPWGYDSWLFAPSPYLYRPGLNSHIVRGKPHYDRTRPVNPPGWNGTRPPASLNPGNDRAPQWTGRNRPPGWKYDEDREPDQAGRDRRAQEMRGQPVAGVPEVLAPPSQNFRRNGAERGAERRAARVAASGGQDPRPIPGTQSAAPVAISPGIAPVVPANPVPREVRPQQSDTSQAQREARQTQRETYQAQREARQAQGEARSEPRSSVRGERDLKQPD